MASKSVSTRQSSCSAMTDFVGKGKEFMPSELPTHRAVIQRGILLKEQTMMYRKHYTNRDIANDLSLLVLAQWSKANAKFVYPVIVDKAYLPVKIRRLWEKVEDIAWKRAKGKQKEDLESYLDRLFDITRCRCSIVLCESTLSECPEPKGCKYQVHIKCVCPLDRKLPKLNLRWIYGQRQKCGEKSDMQINLNDFKETDKQIKAEKRKLREEESLAKRMLLEKKEEDLLDNAVSKILDII